MFMFLSVSTRIIHQGRTCIYAPEYVYVHVGKRNPPMSDINRQSKLGLCFSLLTYMYIGHISQRTCNKEINVTSLDHTNKDSVQYL